MASSHRRHKSLITGYDTRGEMKKKDMKLFAPLQQRHKGWRWCRAGNSRLQCRLQMPGQCRRPQRGHQMPKTRCKACRSSVQQLMKHDRRASICNLVEKLYVWRKIFKQVRALETPAVHSLLLQECFQYHKQRTNTSQSWVFINGSELWQRFTGIA